MSFRSSIFSFDTWQQRPAASKAAVWTVVFMTLTCSAIFAALRFDSVRVLIDPRMGGFLRYADELSIDADKPLVLFVGTSRFRSGIDIDFFSQSDPTRIYLNFSPDDMVESQRDLVLRRIVKNGPKIDLVILETNFLRFNAQNYISRNNRPLALAEIDLWSDLSTRLRSPRPLRALSKTFLFRRSIQQIHRIITRQDFEIAPAQQVGQFYHSVSNSMGVMSYMLLSASYIKDYKMDRKELEEFFATMDWLTSEKIPWVVVHVPVAKFYLKYFETAPENERADYAEVMRAIRTIRPVVVLDTPDQAGLNDSIFFDYGHYKAEGATLFSEYLLKKLREMGFLNPKNIESPE